MTLAQRFKELFNGLDRAYGSYNITTTKAEGDKLVGNDKTIKTIRGLVTEELWQRHFDGETGLGIVPIQDGDTCVFGAIDIDVYDLDLIAICQKIADLKLPLMPCRSKSGGLHAYCFVSEQVPAKLMQTKLKDMAISLGYGGVEIFPKQIHLISERGDVGQWINMPYFGKETTRYAMRPDGSRLEIEDFLATIVKLTKKQLEDFKTFNLDVMVDGPPCLQHLLAHGFPAGTRNDGLFNIAVYLKKSNPEDWETEIQEYNSKYMKPPLTRDEVLNVVKSAQRKDYIYTCSKPPIKPYCNAGLCRTRKHGVGQVTGLPILTGLTKYDARPPIWFVDVEGGGRLELTTEELQNQGKFQRRCMDTLNTMPPSIKQGVWAELIANLLGRVNIIEAPAEATPTGQLLDYLERFCTQRAQARTREELLLGKPWLERERHFFRLSDFTVFLDNQHFRDFTPARIASTLKEKGAEHEFFNLRGKGVNCWSFPEFAKQTEPHDIPDFKTEADL